jgi:hypothetical protein
LLSLPAPLAARTLSFGREPEKDDRRASAALNKNIWREKWREKRCFRARRAREQ